MFGEKIIVSFTGSSSFLGNRSRDERGKDLKKFEANKPDLVIHKRQALYIHTTGTHVRTHSR